MEREKPDWYTIKEAVDYLKIGEPTLYRWMRDGKITFRKVGDSTRFLKEDLDSVVSIHTRKKPAETKGRCSSCGSQRLMTGKLQSTGLLYFKPNKTKFWTLNESNVGLTAEMCADCGLIQFSGDLKKLKALRKNDEENQ
ncbi:MAG: helix-turn-helix domain-containing protein [Lentisphaeria bacterium]|nr:helix-turn-helix domain-containing protein [Lentisphaeria bacterium]